MNDPSVGRRAVLRGLGGVMGVLVGVGTVGAESRSRRLALRVTRPNVRAFYAGREPLRVRFGGVSGGAFVRAAAAEVTASEDGDVTERVFYEDEGDIDLVRRPGLSGHEVLLAPVYDAGVADAVVAGAVLGGPGGRVGGRVRGVGRDGGRGDGGRGAGVPVW